MASTSQLVELSLAVAFKHSLGQIAESRAGGFLAAAFPTGTRAGLLFLASLLKSFVVELDAGIARGIDHEVEGKTEGFVEVEGFFAGEAALQFFIQAGEADLEHAVELLFFCFDNFGDARCGILQFGIGALHEIADGVDHIEEEGLLLTEQTAMTDTAAENFAQHVATALVGWQHAIINEESSGAGVVADDAQACVSDELLKRFAGVGDIGELGGALDQRHEEVRLEVGDLALEHSGHALETHARVDGGLGQRCELVAGGLGGGIDFGRAVELHEDKVPDFDVSGIVVAEGLVDSRVFGGFHAHVVKNLGARTARSGLAHLPEVVFQAVLEDALFWDSRLDPELLGFVVAGDAEVGRAFKNGYIQPFLGKAEPLRTGDQFPRKRDRVALEVVAEGEVAEHFKEGVVAAGKAHVFKIVVLAAGADALLRGGGAGIIALLCAEKQIFELVHSGVGEEQRRIVGRHQRGGVHTAVPLRLKKAQKSFAYLVSGAVLHVLTSVIGK